MASNRTLRLVGGRVRRRRKPGWLLFPAFLLVGSIGGTLLGSIPDDTLRRVLDRPLVRSDQSSVASGSRFTLCSGGTRIDCVVDGDTFWLAGTKIRVADINTPEVSSPRCAAEAQLGRRATDRLRELLGAGPFELVRVDREEDVYGRKLRIVMRNGQSIGDILVAEGLAHHWRGYQQNWC